MRRLATLIVHLPPESAFQRSRRNGWSELEELTALGVAVTSGTTRAVYAAAGAKQSQLPDVVSLPAPHNRARPRREPLTRNAIRRALLTPGR